MKPILRELGTTQRSIVSLVKLSQPYLMLGEQSIKIWWSEGCNLFMDINATLKISFGEFHPKMEESLEFPTD